MSVLWGANWLIWNWYWQLISFLLPISVIIWSFRYVVRKPFYFSYYLIFQTCGRDERSPCYFDYAVMLDNGVAAATRQAESWSHEMHNMSQIGTVYMLSCPLTGWILFLNLKKHNHAFNIWYKFIVFGIPCFIEIDSHGAQWYWYVELT